MQSVSAGNVTALLQAWSEGDLDAREQLMPLVYDELRRRAAACMRRERRTHTLQPTALVHETYLHLVDQRCARLIGRTLGRWPLSHGSPRIRSPVVVVAAILSFVLH